MNSRISLYGHGKVSYKYKVKTEVKKISNLSIRFVNIGEMKEHAHLEIAAHLHMGNLKLEKRSTYRLITKQKFVKIM